MEPDLSVGIKSISTTHGTYLRSTNEYKIVTALQDVKGEYPNDLLYIFLNGDLPVLMISSMVVHKVCYMDGSSETFEGVVEI